MAGRTHDVNIKFNANTSDLKKAESEYRKISKQVKELEKTNMTGSNVKEYREVIKQLDVYKNKIKDLKLEQKKYTEELQKTTREAKRLAGEQSRSDLDAVRRQKQRQEVRGGLGSRTTRALGQSFVEAPLYSVSFAAMAGIAASVQQFVEFDKVLTRIGVVTGRNADSMKLFGTYANDAGKALGVTGKRFAEASLIFLQQGGRSADYAGSLAEASIKLANITGAQASDTSEYVTAIANSFNLLESNAGNAGAKIVDMLAALDSASGSSADEIAQAFKRSASSFAAAGFSAEEASAMIAVVSETTRQASEMVGTGFKTLIGNLSEVKLGSKEAEEITNQLQKAAKQFGISFSLINQYTGQMKGVKEILGEVAQIYNTTTNVAARNALVEAVAGKEQRDRFIALISNQERYNELLGVATNSTGYADIANARYLDSIGAKLEQLNNELEDFINTLTTSSSFKGILDFLNKVTGAFTNMAESGNALTRVLTTMFAALGPLATTKMLSGSLGIGLGGLIQSRGGRRSTENISFENQTMRERVKSNRGLAGQEQATLYGASGAKNLFGGSAQRFLSQDQNEEYQSLRGKNFGDLGDKDKARLGTLQQTVTQGKLGSAVTGGLIGLAGSAAQLINVLSTQNLTTAEKTVQGLSALAPAIGGLFGPAGAAAGAIVGMLIPALFGINKTAQKVRDQMDKLKSTEEETFATKEGQNTVKDLMTQISSPYADQSSQAYIDASNKLAQLLPSISLGTDEFGNAILKSTEAIQQHVDILKEQIKLQEALNYLQAPETFKQSEKIIKSNKREGFGRLSINEQDAIQKAAGISGIDKISGVRGRDVFQDNEKLKQQLDDIIANPEKYANVDLSGLKDRLAEYGAGKVNIGTAETVQSQALQTSVIGKIQSKVEKGSLSSEQGAIQTRKFGALAGSKEGISAIKSDVDSGMTTNEAFEKFYNDNIGAVQVGTQEFLSEQTVIQQVLSESIGRTREEILNALTATGISEDNLEEQNFVSLYDKALADSFEKMDDTTKSQKVSDIIAQMKDMKEGLKVLSVSGEESEYINDIMLNAENSREAIAKMLEVKALGYTLNTRMQEFSAADGMIDERELSLLNKEGAPYYTFSRASGASESLSSVKANIEEQSFDYLRKKEVSSAGEVDPRKIFFKTLYDTEDIDLLKTKYEAIQGILYETLDAHESIIEKSLVQSEIQDEIEKSSNQIYKNNLKTLNTEIQNTKLTRLGLQSLKDRLNLLKQLNASSKAENSPFRLTRLDSGRFRFKQQEGEGGQDSKTSALQAVSDYEKRTRETYVATAEQISALDFQIYDTISKLKDVTKGSGEYTELQGTLAKQQERRGLLGEEAKAYTPEMTRASYASGLIEKGKTDIAQRLIAGSVGIEDINKMGVFTKEEIANITGSVDDVVGSVITSNYDLTLTNAKLTEAINKTTAAVLSLNESFKDVVEPEPDNKKGVLPGGTFVPTRKGFIESGKQEYGLNALGFASGGYTGNSKGMAMLHEKELVLNKADTPNILDAVKIMRTMPSMGSPVPNMNRESAAPSTNQAVNINASFPNVSSSDEIKRAFESLSTRALQYAYAEKSY